MRCPADPAALFFRRGHGRLCRVLSRCGARRQREFVASLFGDVREHEQIVASASVVCRLQRPPRGLPMLRFGALVGPGSPGAATGSRLLCRETARRSAAGWWGIPCGDGAEGGAVSFFSPARRPQARARPLFRATGEIRPAPGAIGPKYLLPARLRPDARRRRVPDSPPPSASVAALPRCVQLPNFGLGLRMVGTAREAGRVRSPDVPARAGTTAQSRWRRASS